MYNIRDDSRFAPTLEITNVYDMIIVWQSKLSQYKYYGKVTLSNTKHLDWNYFNQYVNINGSTINQEMVLY